MANRTRRRLVALTTFLTAASVAAMPAFSAPQGAATAPADAPLSDAQIEQLVAPIALYPDSLMTQILMASTYPLEIVEADRFAKANKDLKGDALAAQLEKQDWDPSVKSLVNFPTVLDMMSEKLDATSKLGDAFLDDQKRVLDAIQRLRAKAQAQGNLKTTEQQIVTVEQQASSQVIVIQPAQPTVVYVPQYNPTVVYGAWPYPAYPPYAYSPPGAAFAAGAIGFGIGVACGAAWGYAWGNCNWGGGDVNINVNQNANFNKNIDRSKYQNQINNVNNRAGAGAGANGKWQHDASHRGGVAYRDNATAQKFGGASAKQATQARDAYRGRTDAGAPGGAGAGRGNLGAGGAGTGQPNRGAAGNPGAGGAGTPNRGNSAGNLGAGGTGAQNRAPAASNRTSSFDGINSGANGTRAASNQGAASRGTTSPMGGGGSRPAGGARPAGGGGGRRR